MTLFIYFVMLWSSLVWSYSGIDSGMYQITDTNAGAAVSTEVVRVEPTIEAAAVPKPANKEAVVPAPKMTSAKNYSLRSAGVRGNLGEPLSFLRSCSPIEILTGQSCEDVKISKNFAPLLMDFLPICVGNAIKTQSNGRSIKKIRIQNAGTHSPRRTKATGKWSLHSTGRAIDISAIDVQLSDGKWIRTPMTIGSRKKSFYQSFNQCWENKMRGYLREINSKCSGYKGIIDCKDKYHHDHIHLSLPFCPRKSGYSTW